MEVINGIEIYDEGISIELDNDRELEALLKDVEDNLILEIPVQSTINLKFEQVIAALGDYGSQELLVYIKLNDNGNIIDLGNKRSLGKVKGNRYIFKGIVKDIFNERYIFDLFYNNNGQLTFSISLFEPTINISCIDAKLDGHIIKFTSEIEVNNDSIDIFNFYLENENDEQVFLDYIIGIDKKTCEIQIKLEDLILKKEGALVYCLMNGKYLRKLKCKFDISEINKKLASYTDMSYFIYRLSKNKNNELVLFNEKKLDIKIKGTSMLWNNLTLIIYGEVEGETDKIKDSHIRVVKRGSTEIMQEQQLGISDNKFTFKSDFNEIEIEEGTYDFEVVLNNEFTFKIIYESAPEMQYNIKETEERVCLIKPYKSTGSALALYVNDNFSIKAFSENVAWAGNTLKISGIVDNSFNADMKDMSCSIVLKLRESDVEIVKEKITVGEDKFDAVIDMKEFLAKEYSRGIWDLFIMVEHKNLKADSPIEISDKSMAKSIVLPIANVSTDDLELYYIRPYYNASNKLSMLIKSIIEFEKVNIIEIKDNALKLDLKIFKREDSLKLLGIDLNKKVEIVVLNDFTEEEYFPGKVVELSGNRLIISANTNNSAIRYKLINNTVFLKLYIGESWFKIKLSISPEQVIQGFLERLQRTTVYKKLAKKSYFIFNKVCPIKNNLMVFESFAGKAIQDNPKYICMEMQNYKDYKKIFILKDTDKPSMDGVEYVKHNTFKYYYYIARAKYLFNNGNYPDFVEKRKGSIHISTWHGTPLKKIGFDVDKSSPSYAENTSDAMLRRIKRWDYLISQNRYSSEIFRRCFKFDGRMLEIGYPRNDAFFFSKERQEEIKNSIRARYNIPKNKKVILYVPTWRDYDRKERSFNINFSIDALKNELSDEYVLLIRTHHLITNDLNLKKYKNFAYNVSNYDDIQELYLLTDVLITDYSSVMFDYTITERPIIFFAYDIARYFGKERGAYFDLTKKNPGPIVHNTEELIEVIKDIDNVMEGYKENYANFKEEFCSLDNGNSSKQVIDFVLENKKYRKSNNIYFLTFNIYGMGGTSRTISNTANYLAESGYKVEIITVFGNKKDQYFKLDKRIKITKLVPNYKNPKNISIIKKILRRIPSVLIPRGDEVYNKYSLFTDLKLIRKLRQIDSGMLISTRPGYNVMLGKYFNGRRFSVLGQEHLNFNAHELSLQKQIKKYYKNLDLLATLTDADTRSYALEIPELKDKIVKIPNAVPPMKDVKNKLENKLLMAAGRLVPQKGFDLLIEACEKVFKKHGDWQLKIFGIGRDKELLQDLIVAKGLTNNIFLMGSTKEIEKELEKVSIYVLSSRFEGFGMVIIESMECGVPVVSFDCPEGPREIINNGVDGILVEDGNTEKLADEIIRLIENKELRVELAQNAKESVKRFSIENIGRLWEEVIYGGKL